MAVSADAKSVGTYSAKIIACYSLRTKLVLNRADQQKLVQQLLATNATQNQATAVTISLVIRQGGRAKRDRDRRAFVGARDRLLHGVHALLEPSDALLHSADTGAERRDVLRAVSRRSGVTSRVGAYEFGDAALGGGARRRRHARHDQRRRGPAERHLIWRGAHRACADRRRAGEAVGRGAAAKRGRVGARRDGALADRRGVVADARSDARGRPGAERRGVIGQGLRTRADGGGRVRGGDGRPARLLLLPPT